LREQFAALNAVSPEVSMSIKERIESSLDTIRPALHVDGGDVEFVGFNQEDGVVQLRLVGACGQCPISSMTVKHGIERRIRAMVPEVTAVEAIG
jgi:Fe-S cluster biogenesis protein NfuA